jgi:uncharacterized protein YecE (DUF72 family)
MKMINFRQMADASHSLKIGPAGWSYPDWAGIAYPKRKPRGFQQAAYLAGYFDTIEINTSFYQPLRPDHCKQWIAQVSGNPQFLFTAKLWRKFTHESGADAEDERAVRAGMEVLKTSGKLGALLLQFPFSFHKSRENHSYLSQLLHRFKDFPLVVELRHATWNEPGFYEFLREENVAFCNIDQPLIGKSLQPSALATAPVAYIRLHGRRYDTWFAGKAGKLSSDRYDYLYSPAELEPWTERIRSLQKDASTVFVILNNHPQAKALVNALQLIRILKKQRIKIPEPLREQYPELNEIASEPPQNPSLFPASLSSKKSSANGGKE